SGRNTIEFALAYPGKLTRNANWSHDIGHSKSTTSPHDRPTEPPPLIVAVTGPAGAGKPSLVQSLVKRYTKHTLSSIQCPTTVATRQKRPQTFRQCQNLHTSIFDISNIADVVLLLIDRNFGFAIKTLEVFNVIAMHGLPSNIFGILTHLDLFASQSVQRTTEKPLKYRLWSELYPGPRLFYIFGVVNGRYPDTEIHNLSAFATVMQTPRPLVCRDSHYYPFADRLVDLTEHVARVDGAKADGKFAPDRDVRGLGFPIEGAVSHISSVADCVVSCVQWLPDPC
ncbi:ribosome biogenesis protein, partial [Tuber brumale]